MGRGSKQGRMRNLKNIALNQSELQEVEKSIAMKKRAFQIEE